jgi:hypothetical protein
MGETGGRLANEERGANVDIVDDLTGGGDDVDGDGRLNSSGVDPAVAPRSKLVFRLTCPVTGSKGSGAGEPGEYHAVLYPERPLLSVDSLPFAMGRGPGEGGA